MAQDPAIVTHGLERRFGARTVVDGIDLEVGRGQIFGFLGPNGAGKTTVIRMLTGILRPSGGGGSVLGYDLIRETEDIKRHIGYVAQHFGLYADLTVLENLEFYASVYGTADPDTLEALISGYGFSNFRTVLASNLSGGYRQRLALICALTHAPKLLFLDEPTAGVDPSVRKELWDLFYELADQGTTLFVTTHYMEEAERCDRLVFIHRGRLVASGTPEEIKASMTTSDVFAVGCRYDPAIVGRAKSLGGVELVNQFGSTLRIVAQRGAYDEDTLRRALMTETTATGPDEAEPTQTTTATSVAPPPFSVTRDQPTIEDVFVTLTGQHSPAQPQ